MQKSGNPLSKESYLGTTSFGGCETTLNHCGIRPLQTSGLNYSFESELHYSEQVFPFESDPLYVYPKFGFLLLDTSRGKIDLFSVKHVHRRLPRK